ncbi:hypothetical protein L249_5802 [Ophiocordyceps polyrhachis-furcata BCC 54312]|uniref:Uncharacterized protein n=1 Tax=Ophiocordyceps polyrhachis-furcata BCC 54312 TaxID=1330021 RepID=A0A367L0C8_9HYPO|nr:hypothetical protein L249_5802 [Ophiocordyceps polyrhachis-furcata BCC 54312]
MSTSKLCGGGLKTATWVVPSYAASSDSGLRTGCVLQPPVSHLALEMGQVRAGGAGSHFSPHIHYRWYRYEIDGRLWRQAWPQTEMVLCTRNSPAQECLCASA